MPDFNLRKSMADVWAKKDKVPVKSVALGSVILIRSETVLDDEDDIGDDEQSDLEPGTPRIDINFQVCIPFSADLSMYKYAGRGYLCSSPGSERPHIVGFKVRDEPRLCVVLFDPTKD
jgi:hypothetical protein